MNKEKVLQIISDAIDRGASVYFHLTQFDKSNGRYENRTKEQAEELISRLEDALGGGEVKLHRHEAADSLWLEHKKIRGTFSFVPDKLEDTTINSSDEASA